MPEKFIIKGGQKLQGEVEIAGYKNSAGAILAGALLSSEETLIDNLPQTSDILNQLEILKQMGSQIEWLGPHKIKIKAKDLDLKKIPDEIFEKIRLSILLIGPLLARFKTIKIPHPGGDRIGLRPIVTHLAALKSLGIKTEAENSYYHLTRPDNFQTKKIVLKEFSVTATEILMMLAAANEGVTKIELAATEPQVQDLGNLLKKMGAEIEGLGTHTLIIKGKKSLKGAEFKICPDLLEVGTFLIAFALTQGRGKIKNVNPEHLTMFLEKMKEIGVNFEIRSNEILINPATGFRATKIQILPYPGFPTDLQPQTSVILTQAQGKSLIHEPLYENRFQHLQELRKLGADIEIADPHRALIFGPTELKGSKVNVSDIRSGAALVLAGLIAKNTTVIENISQIDRGYENLDEKLKKLGAQIERITS
ncbi:MAG: UDP-N-acetylglucosamine 1-carboxyvinyltransferase [Minisyncoccales bacterium]